MISYCLITIFTPGPNNISSMSMGILYGYKRTLRYITGIALGFFLIMLTGAFVAAVLLALLPAFESYLRIAGALYIAWLALETLRKSHAIEIEQQAPHGFWHGLFLQILNPKVVIFSLTVYAAFLTPLQGYFHWQLAAALILAALAFVSCSFWALSGSGIRHYLNHPRVHRAVNLLLALLLLYTALELSGLIAWLCAFIPVL
ncbi:MAG: LysE family translocator [Pelolinea sp.]|nr:LysE family translocator [Pelolinea sp.]